MATFLFNGKPRCPMCKSPIAFAGSRDGKEIYKCKCGLCDEERPEIKN